MGDVLKGIPELSPEYKEVRTEKKSVGRPKKTIDNISFPDEKSKKIYQIFKTFLNSDDSITPTTSATLTLAWTTMKDTRSPSDAKKQ